MMTPVFFANQADLRKWFEENHTKEKELLLGYYKVGTQRPSITWSQSVDEALCFGWIDGVRKSIDEQSYCIRFTPRKVKSIWSAVNIKKVAQLTALGLMQPAGIAIFENRQKDNTNKYSYEIEAVKFEETFDEKFRSNKSAWAFFQSQAPYYQKNATKWVMSAKQEATRLNRLAILIKNSEEGKKI
jgi:uncharacterized protein YdeI (YjbR/CyaY-like superfamily)